MIARKILIVFAGTLLGLLVSIYFSKCLAHNWATQAEWRSILFSSNADTCVMAAELVQRGSNLRFMMELAQYAIFGVPSGIILSILALRLKDRHGHSHELK